MTERPKSFRKILHLSFPAECSGQPIMSQLARRYDLTFNILIAQISPRKEGSLTIGLEGTEENWKDARAYLESHGIKAEPAAQHIRRDEESCMHCGLCTSVCPADALVHNQQTRRIDFFEENCTACGMCTKICPVNAMQVDIAAVLI